MENLYFEGPLIGIATFLAIGFFHPVVVKTEYHFGTRPWWVFLLIGVGGTAAALFIENVLLSAVISVVAFSSLWTIKELFEQEERVIKRWFPENPARSDYYARRRTLYNKRHHTHY